MGLLSDSYILVNFRVNAKRDEDRTLKAAGQEVEASGGGREPLDLRKNRPFLYDSSLDCCPSVTEMSEIIFGINWLGVFVELYHDEDEAQAFYETICLPHVKDRPCQFVAERFVHRSRCVQQYSYAYAVVRTIGSEEYYVDMIRVAAGCKCRLDSD